MKKLYIIVCFLFFFSKANSQPSELFEHTWYLHYVTFDKDGGYSIASIQPPISPYLIINADLSFEGFGACNEFSGYFNYGVQQGTEMLFPFDFERTFEQCVNQEHISFETNYFEWFDHDDVLRFWVYCNSNNQCDLELEYYAGFFFTFSNSPILSTVDIDKQPLKLYPNPVGDLLNIVSINRNIEVLNIYTISGTQLYKGVYQQQLDVSNLTPGIYFIEISSPKGKSVQKFVKK